jgi:hypothetical protein
MKQVGESLAGRLAVCEMTPFLAAELPVKAWDRLWRFGGYPDGGVQDPAAFPAWANDYLTLLAQRDFPVWGLPAGGRRLHFRTDDNYTSARAGGVVTC